MEQSTTTPEKRESLRLAREAADLTQYDLAIRAGLSQSKLSLFEKGHVDLTAAEIRKLEAEIVKAVGRNRSGDSGFSLNAARIRALGETPSADNQRRLRRERARLSQHALAKATGIYRSKISEWENGIVELTPDEFTKVNAVLSRVEVADPYSKLEHNIEMKQEYREMAREAAHEYFEQKKLIAAQKEIIGVHEAKIEALEQENKRLRGELDKLGSSTRSRQGKRRK